MTRQKHLLDTGWLQDANYKLNNLNHRANFVKAKQEYERLLPIYEKESNYYHSEVQKLNESKGLFAKILAESAKGDLESTIGEKVFSKAKRLKDLQTKMHSYVVQDLEQQINIAKDKLSLNAFATSLAQRTYEQQASFSDYCGAAGVLFGCLARHTYTYATGLATRHQDALNISGATFAFAAPVATVIGVGIHSTLSTDTVQNSMLSGLDLALEGLGIDKYSREDISRATVGGVKLAASGVGARYINPRAITAGFRASRNVGRQGFAAFDAHVENMRNTSSLSSSASSASTDEFVSLYRAVRPEEVIQIRNTGKLENIRGIEKKYFSTTYEGAKRYASMAEKGFGDQPYKIVETKIPKIIYESLPHDLKEVVDNGIHAVLIPTESLEILSSPLFLDNSFKPVI